MDNIKLKVKLSAYTKGAIPHKVSELINDEHFIPEAPNDGQIYARQNNEWRNIKDAQERQEVITHEKSGIIINEVDLNTIDISLDKWEGNFSDLPDILNEGTIYFVAEDRVDLILIGGTAYSDGWYDDEFDDETDKDFIKDSYEPSEYDDIIFYGGTASTAQFELELIPVNCKGEIN